MTLQQILEHKNKQYYRVNDSTYNPVPNTKKMIGGIFKAREICLKKSIIALDGGKGEDDYWGFNLSDVQQIPVHHFEDDRPVFFTDKNGKEIGIGDVLVNSCSYEEDITVYGYHWINGNFLLDYACHDNFNSDCWTGSIKHFNQITYKLTSSLSLKQKENWIKEGREKGYIKDGEIVV